MKYKFEDFILDLKESVEKSIKENTLTDTFKYF